MSVPRSLGGGSGQEPRAAGEEGVLYAELIARARKGTASPRSAIKAFCLECAGLIRKDITGCTATQCPLHKYRPYQQGGES